MKIAVLYGGNSSERNVSLNSGLAVISALHKMGHDVLTVDPAFGGCIKEYEIKAVGELPPTEEELRGLPGSKNPHTIVEALNFISQKKVDVVFNALHGGIGENGALQAIMDVYGLRYTGSGSAASAIAMNKTLTKRIAETERVPSAAYVFLPRNTDQNQIDEIVRSKVSGKIVVKPNDDGSSVGLSIVDPGESLQQAFLKAASIGDVLFESFIDGRELTVAVLGDQTLPVVEIKPEGGVYDYKHKYTKGLTQYFCPAEIDLVVSKKAQEFAIKAFRSVGCKGYARVDFRMNQSGELFCLEINTLPGMTATSLVPKAAKAGGMEFEELVEKIIRLALP
ncbi:MAG TPA: D-alanine--D-alanine ligase [bacterium]|nr:D-alanine--D-alanine ligase [bacterium]HNH27920.1 D-alanine--D-alanine ligase [bacterium]